VPSGSLVTYKLGGTSVVDPHHLDAAPDPTFHPDANPDPDPDPCFKKNPPPTSSADGLYGHKPQNCE
jgi:hypothetical protein